MTKRLFVASLLLALYLLPSGTAAAQIPLSPETPATQEAPPPPVPSTPNPGGTGGPGQPETPAEPEAPPPPPPPPPPLPGTPTTSYTCLPVASYNDPNIATVTPVTIQVPVPQPVPLPVVPKPVTPPTLDLTPWTQPLPPCVNRPGSITLRVSWKQRRPLVRISDRGQVISHVVFQAAGRWFKDDRRHSKRHRFAWRVPRGKHKATKITATVVFGCGQTVILSRHRR